jgi:proteic killer suppression protein
MEVEFDSDELDRLERDAAFTGGYGVEIVRGFRKVMLAIRAAHDERDLYALRGLRFEQLKGKRTHQHSLRINRQWRLIVELRGKGATKQVGVVGIEDYHY